MIYDVFAVGTLADGTLAQTRFVGRLEAQMLRQNVCRFARPP